MASFILVVAGATSAILTRLDFVVAFSSLCVLLARSHPFFSVLHQELGSAALCFFNKLTLAVYEQPSL